MKNSIVILFLALLLGVMVGCTPQKAAVQTQQIPVQQLEQKLPGLWLQNTYSSVDPSDPITFFNEDEIVVMAEIPKKMIMFKDGATYRIDSSTVVTYVIPAMTPGVLVDVKRDRGVIKEMVISFNEGDENYNCIFVPGPSNAMYLNLYRTIHYEGKPYLVKATNKNDGQGNRLRSNFYDLKQQNQVNGSASGRNAIGTKIILNNK